jgi:hypothetical protein
MARGRREGRPTPLEEHIMTASYTFDVFSSLDGYGAASGSWTLDANTMELVYRPGLHL